MFGLSSLRPTNSETPKTCFLAKIFVFTCNSYSEKCTIAIHDLKLYCQKTNCFLGVIFRSNSKSLTNIEYRNKISGVFLLLLKQAKADRDDLSLSWENVAIVNVLTNLSAVEDQNYADHYNYDPTKAS